MPLTKVCPECQAELPGDAPDGPCPQCVALRRATTAAGVPAEGKESGTPSHWMPFTAPAPAALALHFPQLEILELLGQGGMGAVYKARQPNLDRLTALKILPPEAAHEPAFAERFTREARALAKLDHPNIITVYDFGRAGELYYFIMEFVDGASLRQLLRSGALPPAEALRIIPQICDALQFAHEEGVVHRDIKPENILLDKRGRVKIADFGIAKILGGNTTQYTLTGPWQVVGTLHYMAPEQMDNPLKVDHRADIYSLGVVFYELLTHQLPLGRFAPPSHKTPVDARLDPIVLRALENEPDRRYQKISELKTEVEQVTLSRPAATLMARPADAIPTAIPVDRPTALRKPVLTPRHGPPLSEEARIKLARQRLRLPAAALACYGVLVFIYGKVLAIRAIAAASANGGDLGFSDFFGIVLGATILVGAWKMWRLTSRRFALVAAVLCFIPIIGKIPWLGIPVGIWVLLTLRHRDVSIAFRIQQARSAHAA
jgi:predicted Ser/Thr protein kinase